MRNFIPHALSPLWPKRVFDQLFLDLTFMGHTPNAIRAALFVDFDNVYLSLRNFDRRAADAFAGRPTLWLDWLESGAHAALGEDGVVIPRRVLIRNCYLNPAAFSRQRSFFTRAAFTVVDCPSLTARGKNSADILMAMDILDAVNHPTRFDEFIILTSDADFTPVLLRLRAHDRITSVLTSTITAAAFREACDVSIDLETFAVEALGLPQEELRSPNGSGVISEGQPPSEDYADDRPKAARALVEEVNKSGIIPTQDAHKILGRIGAFQNSYWFGMGTLKALLDELVRLEPELFVEMDGSLPATIRLRNAGDPEVVATAPPPLRETLPEQEFTPTEAPPQPEITPEIARFMEDINVLAGAPKLIPSDYADLFDALAMALVGGAVDRDQVLHDTGANLPDGAQVRRGDASFVISTLADEGVLAQNGAARLSAAALAIHFRDIMLEAVEHAQRSLDEDERAMLDQWLIGAASEELVVEDPEEDEEPADDESFDDGSVDDDPIDDERTDDGLTDEEDMAEDEDLADRLSEDGASERIADADGSADKTDFDDPVSEPDESNASEDDDDPSPSGKESRDGLRLPWDRRWRTK